MPMTPDLALAYLTALSADIQAAAVLDTATRAHRAGSTQLANAAARLTLPADAHQDGVHVAAGDEHTIVVVTGPFELPRLTHHDLHTALGHTPPTTPPEHLDSAIAHTLRQAASNDFRRPSAV